uniref:Uncharacterized protein n=1 Tax=Cucumis melo TaxID=3656 RepID=A0A9I9EE13_CUCME
MIFKTSKKSKSSNRNKGLNEQGVTCSASETGTTTFWESSGPVSLLHSLPFSVQVRSFCPAFSFGMMVPF